MMTRFWVSARECDRTLNDSNKWIKYDLITLNDTVSCAASLKHHTVTARFRGIFQRTERCVWCSSFHCWTFSSPLYGSSGIHLGFYVRKKEPIDVIISFINYWPKVSFAYIHFSLCYLRLLYLTSSPDCFSDYSSSVWLIYTDYASLISCTVLKMFLPENNDCPTKIKSLCFIAVP